MFKYVALTVISLLVLSNLFLIIYVLKIKKKTKELERFEILADILEVSNRYTNVFKALKDINSIILNAFDMDYSSFFILHNDDYLVLKDTNITNEEAVQNLSSIKDYRDNSGDAEDIRDFRHVFEERRYIWLYSDEELVYPGAKERGIHSAFMVPLIANGKLIGVWLIEDCSPDFANRIDSLNIVMIADYISSILAYGLYVYFDELTQLPKREFLNEFINDCKKANKRFSIVYSDIDNFSNFNNEYGHDVGDQVLKTVAGVYLKNIRQNDMVGRYGGEEILFCLPDCNKQESVEIIERVRQALENELIQVKDKTLNITASFGVCTYPDDFKEQDGIDIKKIIKLADERMYMAKNQGKNRVISN